MTVSTAQEALGLALAALADRGERTPCQPPGVRDRWTSDSREDREYAAASCSGCPVYTRCAGAAGVAREPWGVWAGVDRTPGVTWARRCRPGQHNSTAAQRAQHRSAAAQRRSTAAPQRSTAAPAVAGRQTRPARQANRHHPESPRRVHRDEHLLSSGHLPNRPSPLVYPLGSCDEGDPPPSDEGEVASLPPPLVESRF